MLSTCFAMHSEERKDTDRTPVVVVAKVSHCSKQVYCDRRIIASAYLYACRRYLHKPIATHVSDSVQALSIAMVFLLAGALCTRMTSTTFYDCFGCCRSHITRNDTVQLRPFLQRIFSLLPRSISTHERKESLQRICASCPNLFVPRKFRESIVGLFTIAVPRAVKSYLHIIAANICV